MMRFFSMLCILLFSSLSFSASIFPANPAEPQFNVNDIAVINKFCISYKNDLIKNFDIVTSQNVSKETFALFVKKASKLKPATLDFFDTLRGLGAEDCNFF